MRVALFGGTGFVGSYLIDTLLDAGHNPSVLVRPGSEHKVRQVGRCRLTQGDIASERAIKTVLKDCDAIIYNIGILRENRRLGITFEELHYAAVERVANAAKECRPTYLTMRGRYKYERRISAADTHKYDYICL